MYGWIITEDLEANPEFKAPHPENAVGMMGPKWLDDDVRASLLAGDGDQFQMLDDDLNIVYRGRFVGDSQSEQGFRPLDDFGTPNYGCTIIEYKRGKGWERL